MYNTTCTVTHGICAIYSNWETSKRVIFMQYHYILASLSEFKHRESYGVVLCFTCRFPVIFFILLGYYEAVELLKRRERERVVINLGTLEVEEWNHDTNGLGQINTRIKKAQVFKCHVWHRQKQTNISTTEVFAQSLVTYFTARQRHRQTSTGLQPLETCRFHVVSSSQQSTSKIATRI